jgi:hypothetical protein
VHDHGLDQARYQHLKRIAKKQWQSGKPVKGERNSQQLWRHVRRQNRDAAHKGARAIANVCAKYPGCVLLFERLRKIPAKGGAGLIGSTANKRTNCEARSTSSHARKLLPSLWLPWKSIPGKLRRGAPAAGRAERGSQCAQVNASSTREASSSAAPFATMKRRQTTTPV